MRLLSVSCSVLADGALKLQYVYANGRKVTETI